MNTLKAIYRNEIEIKKISLLKAFFIMAIFIVVPIIISPVSFFIMLIIDENISFGQVMITTMIIEIPIKIIMIIVIGKMGTKKDSIKISNNKMKFTKKDCIYIFLIIIGYILIREALLFDILSVFEGPISDEDIDLIIKNSTTIEANIMYLLLYLKSIVEAPILEELFFRGIVLSGLLNKYKKNPNKAIIYSAIAFGIVHLNIPQGINAFIGGLMLGFIYYYTKSMKLSIFAHFINNLIIFIPVPSSIIIKIIYVGVGLYCMIKGIKYIKRNENNELLIV